MFDMTEFLKSNLIRGFHDGSFTESQVSIFAANYMLKGWFTQADFEEVIQAMQQSDEVDDEVYDEVYDEVNNEVSDEVSDEEEPISD